MSTETRCKAHKGEAALTHPYTHCQCGHQYCAAYWVSCPRCYGSSEANRMHREDERPTT